MCKDGKWEGLAKRYNDKGDLELEVTFKDDKLIDTKKY